MSPSQLLILDENPDGRLTVRNTVKNSTVQLLGFGTDEFRGWSPNSRMMAHLVRSTVSDALQVRSRGSYQLWITGISSDQPNSAYVDSDVDRFVLPSWSSDCTKLTYCRGGQLYIADLVWKKVPKDEEEGKAE